MTDTPGNGDEGNGGAGAAEPDKPKRKPATPRPYTVLREVKASQLEAAGVKPNDTVLVVVGTASATTPKAARVEVAKDKIDREALVKGVELNAVASGALASGKAPVKLEVQEKLI